MHHLTSEISCLLHSVNHIVFTLLLVHLILQITSSQSLSSLSPSLTSRFFTPDLSTVIPQIRSSIVSLVPFGLTSRILSCGQTSCALALVCFSFTHFCTSQTHVIAFTYVLIQVQRNSNWKPLRAGYRYCLVGRREVCRY